MINKYMKYIWGLMDVHFCNNHGEMFVFEASGCHLMQQE